MSLAEVSEYGSVRVPFELTEADRRTLLAPELSKHLKLLPAPDGGWMIRASDVIGVLQLDNGVLEISPKIVIGGEALLHWLHYAMDQPRTTRTSKRRPWDVGGAYFTDMVVEAFLDECTNLLRGQLRQDYQRNESVDRVLRGKLDVAAQATRRYGLVDRLHVRTFDRTADIWENQVCGAALRHAAQTASSAALRTETLRLLARFPECTFAAALATLARARHNRLNHRYRTAHTWAGVILRSEGVRDLFVRRELVGDSYLLDMPVMWERVVRRMVDSTTIIPVDIKRPGTRAVGFNPDAVVLTVNGKLAVDAKYKDYDNDKVERNDIHQLLTYASAYRLSGTERLRAAILYPSTSRTEKREIKVDFGGSPLAVIDLIGVDVSVHPEVNSVTLRSLLRR